VALLQSRGKLTFLRVHEVGGKFGPPTDQIDVEAVLKLNTHPDRAMGFQIRDDSARPVRQGMLDLLRDAFSNDFTVVLDYELDTGKLNGVVIRVALEK
jgi:hypothetical protein